jgi:chromosome segregation ATPase
MALYESIKVKLHDSLQRTKTPLARIKSASAVGLHGELDELERILTGTMRRLKAAVDESEAQTVAEAEQTEQLVDNLKTSIAELEVKLAEMHETLQRKDSSHQQMEESFAAKVQDLENVIMKKDEALVNRDSVIRDLKSELDDRTKQIEELKIAIENAKEEAANNAKRAAHIAESAQISNAALESRLREQEELSRQKDVTISDLEQTLNTQFQDFEHLMKDKEELLASRNAVINDLKSQLNLMTQRKDQKSSFLTQAEASVSVERRETGRVAPSESVEDHQDNTVSAASNSATIIVPSAGREIASGEVFQRIAHEFTEASGVMGIIASLIIGQHVAALGESMASFPKRRLPELLDQVAKEIPNEDRQIEFRQRLVQDTYEV